LWGEGSEDGYSSVQRPIVTISLPSHEEEGNQVKARREEGTEVNKKEKEGANFGAPE